jgi:hypothetical protein
MTTIKLLPLVIGCTLLSAASAQAQDDPPAVVTYIAPVGCTSASAFQKLLDDEIAQNPRHTPRRFFITINRGTGGAFVGTLKTEAAARVISASTCDEVTAGLATIIAMAQTDATPPTVVSVTTVLAPTNPVPIDREARVPRSTLDERRMRSPALLGTGITMSIGGLAATAVGTWIILAARTQYPLARGTGVPDYDASDRGGAVLIGGGLAFVVTGVLMSVFGLQRQHVTVEGGPLGSTGLGLHVSF